MAKPNARRMKQIKRSLAARDGACCFYCGDRFAQLRDATVDHLIPQSVIPGWKLANLVLACRPCNEAKADTLPQLLLRPVGYRPGLVPVRRRSWLVGLVGRFASAWAGQLRTV